MAKPTKTKPSLSAVNRLLPAQSKTVTMPIQAAQSVAAGSQFLIPAYANVKNLTTSV
jgi:hypothetical protein